MPKWNIIWQKLLCKDPNEKSNKYNFSLLCITLIEYSYSIKEAPAKCNKYLRFSLKYLMESAFNETNGWVLHHYL